MPISHALLRGETKEFFNKYLITKNLIMRKFTFKSLLIAAALCLGTSAWAATGDVKTNVDIDFSNEIITSETSPKYSIQGAIGSMSWDGQWTVTPYISDGLLRFGNFTGAVNLEGDAAGTKDVVTISFEMAFGKLTKKNVGFNFKDADGNVILSQRFDAYNGDFDDNNPLNLNWNSMYRGANTANVERCVYFTISLDYSNSTITTHTRCFLSGTGKSATEATYTSSLPSVNPIRTFELYGNINNAERYSTFDNLKITTTEGDYSAASSEYTVKYICNGVEIKTSETRTGDVGAAISLIASDKENFFNDDRTMKYMYVSDDASSKTIANDGKTEVTVTFREAETYNYTVNAVNAVGEKLKELATGSNFEGEKSRAYVTKGLNINGGWYITSGNGSYPTYGYDFTEAATKNVTYTVDENVDYFFEVEDINKSRDWAAIGAYPERYSNGKTGRLYKGAYAFTDALAGGVYTITLWARNNSGSAVANVGLYYRDTNGNATPLGVNFADWDKGLSAAKTLENVIIPDGASLMLKNESPDYNSNLEMDYLIFTKTGEATVSTTITAAGYATFSSTYAVDFSESGLAAYTATVSENKVVMTPIENGIVPANTGVILKGAARDYTGVITTTEAVIENNDLVAATEEIASLATETTVDEVKYKNYILNVVDQTPGFYQANDKKVAAGKAYLQVLAATVAEAKALTIVWNDGETTGIEENYEFGTMNSDAATFDLSGRKVANPAKGLYIKNGKKFIVK